MIPLILVGLIVGMPVILALLLRVSAVFLFLSLLVGDIVVKYLSDDVTMALAGFIKSPWLPTVTQLSCLLLPMVLTMVGLRKSLPRSKMLMHILPLIFVGLSTVVLALPLMTSGTQAAIFDTKVGDVLRNSQDLLVSTAAVLVLTLAWHTYKHRPDKKHH